MSPAFRPGSLLDRAFGSKQERALAPPGVSMYGSYGIPAPFKPQESLDAYDYNVWLYRSVLTIAMEMASVDLKLKVTTSTDTVKYVDRHQVLETMRRPQETKTGNCQLSGMILRIVTGMHLLLNGEGFWIFSKRTKSQDGRAPTGSLDTWTKKSPKTFG